MNRAKLIHEAFATVPKQVHVWMGGKFYRVFGEGDERRIRSVQGENQPLLRDKQLRRSILELADEASK